VETVKKTQCRLLAYCVILHLWRHMGNTEETTSASFCHSVTICVLYDMQCTSTLPFTHFGTNLWPCIFYLCLEGVMFVIMKNLRIKTKAK
jgi:hypothetical protein